MNCKVLPEDYYTRYNMEIVKKYYQEASRTVQMDFDDTITEKFSKLTFANPLIKPEIKFEFEEMRKHGLRILIHTCRINPNWETPLDYELFIIENALKKAGVPYDEVWQKIGKPYARYICDDLFNPYIVGKTYKEIIENFLEDPEWKIKKGHKKAGYFNEENKKVCCDCNKEIIKEEKYYLDKDENLRCNECNNSYIRNILTLNYSSDISL